MLILGRKAGESILLDGGVRIVVVSCDRRGVRLGIEAPPEVGIVRGELAGAIAEENQRAAAVEAARGWLGMLGVGDEGAAEPESVAPRDADAS